MIKKTKSIELYKRAAKKYFTECDKANSECSEKAPFAKPYTLSGLLCALELTREEFLSLSKSREGKKFTDAALMKIESFIEENALSGRLSSSAAQSSLKYSFGWNDREKQTDRRNITVSLSEEARTLGE